MDYRKVKDLYDTLKDAGQTSLSLPDWSTEMNNTTGTDMFSAGLHDNIIKRANVGLDRLIEKTGAPEALASAFSPIDNALGTDGVAAQIGHDMPRMVVNTAPAFAGPIGLGLSGLLTGTDTYTKTDSTMAGLVSGGLAVAMPGVGSLIRQKTLKALGGNLVEGALADAAGNVTEKVSQYVPKTFGQSAAALAAEQIGLLPLQEAGNAAQSVATGSEYQNPFSKEGLLNLTLGQLPFAGISALDHLRTGKSEVARGQDLQKAIDTSAGLIKMKEAMDVYNNRSVVDRIPDVDSTGEPVSPVTEAKIKFHMDRIRDQGIESDVSDKLGEIRDGMAKVQDEASPDAMEEFNRLSKLEQDELDRLEGNTAQGSLFGEKLTPKSGRFEVTGTTHYEKGNFRIVKVDDTPENGPWAGKLVGYSTHFEPPLEGNRWSIPHRYSSEFQDNAVKPVDAPPALPTMADAGTEPSNPGSQEWREWKDRQTYGVTTDRSAGDAFDHVAALDAATAKVDAAKTAHDMRAAYVDINNVRAAHGIDPVTSATINKRIDALLMKDPDRQRLELVTKQVARAEAAKTRREIIAKRLAEERVQEVTAGEAYFAAQAEKALQAKNPETGEPRPAADPDFAEEWTAVNNMHEVLANRGTVSAEKFRASGEFYRLYHQWTLNGKQGGLEGLGFQLTKAARQQTKNLLKAESVAEPVTKVGATPKIEQISETALRLDAAYIAMADPEARKLYEDWSRKVAPKAEPNYEYQQEILRFLTENGVSTRRFEVEDLADTFAKDRGISLDDAIDELTVFSKSPLAGLWDKRMQEYIANRREQKMAPGPVGRDYSLHTPEDDQSVARMQELNLAKGGTGLHEYLMKSEDPMIREFATVLGQYPEALARVKVNVLDMDGGGFTHELPDGVGIGLSSGLLKASKETREFIALHELVHGVTLQELTNPSKAGIVKDIDALRLRAIETLPKAERALFDAAVASDWYGRNDRSLDELGDTHAKQMVLYSLLSTHELVSQGFSSKPVKEYLQKVKSEKNQTMWQRLTNGIKSLLGIKTDAPSAFDDLMSKSQALMEQGEYVSSFRSFAESKFEELGLTPEQVRAQTERALGLVLDSGDLTHEGALIDYLTVEQAQPSAELVEAKRQLTRHLADPEAAAGTVSVLSELGYGGDIRGVDELLATTLNYAPEDHALALDLLPEPVLTYLAEKASDMKQLLQVVQEAADGKNKGIVNLTDGAGLHKSATDALAKLKTITAAKALAEEGSQMIMGMNKVTPEGFFDALTQPKGEFYNAPNVREALGDMWADAKSIGKAVNDFLEPAGQWAMYDKGLGEVLSKGFQLLANARKIKHEVLKAFGVDLSKMGTGEDPLTKESVKRTEKVMGNQKLLDKINRWIYTNQVEGKKNGESVKFLAEDHPSIKPILAGLSPSEVSDVFDIVSKHQISQQAAQGQVLESMLQVSAARGATIIGRMTGLKVHENMALAEKMIRALTLDVTDPASAAQVQAEIGTVQAKLTPESFLALLEYSQNKAESWKLHKEFFSKNPAWSSGQRVGKWDVTYMVGNRVHYDRFESRAEARTAIRKAGGREKSMTRVKGFDDQQPLIGINEVGLYTRLQELERNQLDMLQKSGMFSSEQLEEIARTSDATQFIRESSANHGVGDVKAPARNLSKGADKVPWLANHFAWVDRTANYWSRAILREQAKAYLMSPDIANAPEKQKRLQTHFDNVLQPDTKIGHYVNAVTSMFYLGYNTASAMVNATQPFLTHVSELTAMSGKPLDSYRRTLSALREVTGNTKIGKALTGSSWKSADHEWLMHEAAKDGELDLSMHDDRAAAQESIATDYVRAMNGAKSSPLANKLATASGAAITGSMWLFKAVERVNTQAAILSSFDYYRQTRPEMGREWAKEQAYQFNHGVNYSGGRANRPVGAFSGRGPVLRTTAMIATSMQTYVLGSVFQTLRYLKQGLFRPAGLTPGEIANARKAGLQMMGTQLAFAGVMGMPFVAAALSLMEQFFPDQEPNKKVRTGLSNFLSSEGENGSVLADIAMTGLPSMLGWDFQSRLSMGNTLPGVSEINGFQPENLMGPPANLITSFIGGGKKFAAGDFAGGAKSFTPPAFKKLVELVKSDGKVEDFKGQSLFAPTPGEQIGLAIGFNPKRLSDFNAASRMAQANQRLTTQREGEYTKTQAELVMKGDFGTVRQNLLARANEDKGYNPMDAVRKIAEAAEVQAFPRDLRREGSLNASPERERLLRAFRIESEGTSEVTRLQFRQQIASRLGLQTTQTSEIQVAQLMDQLRKQQPFATKAELRRAATSMMRPQSQRTLSLPEEQQ